MIEFNDGRRGDLALSFVNAEGESPEYQDLITEIKSRITSDDAVSAEFLYKKNSNLYSSVRFGRFIALESKDKQIHYSIEASRNKVMDNDRVHNLNLAWSNFSDLSVGILSWTNRPLFSFKNGITIYDLDITSFLKFRELWPSKANILTCYLDRFHEPDKKEIKTITQALKEAHIYPELMHKFTHNYQSELNTDHVEKVEFSNKTQQDQTSLQRTISLKLSTFR